VKLRIQGNSLRLRLTQKEVAQLRDPGRVESFIEFAPGNALLYLLESSFRVNAVTATFDGQAIRVIVPKNVMTEWAESDRVSIEAQPHAGVHMLIEKDFRCLHTASTFEVNSVSIQEAQNGRVSRPSTRISQP
jgi:hypothetical protein